jgi:hypothetical protein
MPDFVFMERKEMSLGVNLRRNICTLKLKIIWLTGDLFNKTLSTPELNVQYEKWNSLILMSTWTLNGVTDFIKHTEVTEQCQCNDFVRSEEMLPTKYALINYFGLTDFLIVWRGDSLW